MGAKKITVEDVAKAAGVSKATVSNYINHRYSNISDATIQVLNETVDKLGYVVNKNYTRYKKTMLIGLIVSDITDPFISNLCKGVNDAVTKLGYGLIIANTDNDASLEKNYIKNLITKADGLIINSSGMDSETLNLLSNSIPVVLADRVIENSNFDIVTSNNYVAMTELVQYVYDLGYTEFAFFTESLLSGSARNIRCQAFTDFGVAQNAQDRFCVYQNSLFDDNLLISQMEAYLKATTGKKRVIIGANGRMTLMVISALTKLNYKIPEDVGVCGYDDFDWASILKGGVTTVQQPTYDIGYECVERLYKRIKKEDLPVKHIYLHSRLILRCSL